MLRFIHSSDWHLTAGKFFDETLRCLEFIAEAGEREKVDAFLLPGDFTHSDLPHRVQVPAERNVLADLLSSMAAVGEVLIVPGNHDIVGDLHMFDWLTNVFVMDTAELWQGKGLDILAAPYPHKRHWLANRVAGAVEGQRQEVGHALGHALRALAQQRRPGVPLLGLAHLNIAGSKLGGGEQLIGQEIELSPADLDEIGCDYWALGHIHEPQQVSERGYYPSTPQPHSFGDSNRNGFNLVEIEGPGKAPRVTFIETPAVKLVSWALAWTGTGWLDDGVGEFPEMKGAHLRIVATVEEAARETAQWANLDRIAADCCAASVKIERRIIPTTRVRSEQIRAAHTVDQKLRAFWATLNPAPEPSEQAGALDVLSEIA